MMLSILSMLILTAAAVVCSVISGMTGMGGGTILLAIIASMVPTEFVVPLHGTVQLISNSTRLALFFKHIRWKIIVFFLIGIVPGAIFGISIFKMLDKNIIKLLMGIFILAVTWIPKSRTERTSSFALFLPIGFVSGLIGIFFGAIGPFIAPFFMRKDIIKEQLVATKAACQAISHVIKIILFGFIGINVFANWQLLIALGIAVILGTMIGKKLLGKLSDKTFKRIFKILLTIIAFRIVILQIIKLI
ncbi:MAG: sulfite exporter TauE/SafE family protein [Planctomycetes bacterium]|nr:sulfite exporter TauE/SafE family protein [Planctomycetota bacterium]